MTTQMEKERKKKKKPHCGGAASKRTQQLGSWVLGRADSRAEAPRGAKNAARSQRTSGGKGQPIPRLM